MGKVTAFAKDTRSWAAVAALAFTFIAGWEGLDLTAKHLPFDPPGVITACIGMTNFDRPDLRIGQKFTKPECEQFFREDLVKYEAQLRKCIPGDLPPQRHVALLSFTYNVGQGNLCRSSVAWFINHGMIQRGCDALMLYTKANGKVLQGLINRRSEEREWCLRND